MQYFILKLLFMFIKTKGHFDIADVTSGLKYIDIFITVCVESTLIQ